MEDKELSFVGHLSELRRVIIISIIGIAIGTIISFYFSKQILGILMKPVGNLVFIAPQEAFVTYLKVSFVAGILLALPIIMYQIWGFVSVALKAREKKYAFYYAPFSLLLFFSGVVFVYFVILPVGIKFLLGFATDMLKPMISVSKYISFAGMLFIAFGIVFELPLVIMFLTKIHIVTPQWLTNKRKSNILIIFIVSALLTPPDIVTQLLMAGPLIFLYEVSIILSKIVYKSNK